MMGIINLNKPQKYTSHDCVAIIRKKLGIKRVGHTGTLDPMAQGVLPICIGTATRIIDYLDEDIKEYRCTVTLGIETDTCDIWGAVTKEEVVPNLTTEQIETVLKKYTGKIQQTPPIYSALKVNGKKLYEYARAGQEVEIKSREITVQKITLEEVDLPEITFTVLCSKGTYIRSLCRDFGNDFSCGGTMSFLERRGSGKFQIEDSISLDKIKSMDKDDIEKLILPTDYPLKRFKKIEVDLQNGKDFVHGKHLSPKELFLDEKDFTGKNAKNKFRIYYKGRFLGVGYYNESYKKLLVDKVFNTEIINENI